MTKIKSRRYQLAQQMEDEQRFLNDPAAVDPFVSLGTFIILASEQLELFRKGDLKAGDLVCEYMERIKEECNNVSVDVKMRNLKGV